MDKEIKQKPSIAQINGVFDAWDYNGDIAILFKDHLAFYNLAYDWDMDKTGINMSDFLKIREGEFEYDSHYQIIIQSVGEIVLFEGHGIIYLYRGDMSSQECESPPCLSVLKVHR